MTSLMTGAFTTLGSCVGFLVKFVVGGACLVGTTLYITKPDEKSFDEFLKNECRKPSPDMLGKAYEIVIRNCSTPVFTDYIVAKTVDVYIFGSKRQYVGFLGTWFSPSPKTKKTTTLIGPDGKVTVTEIVD